MEENLLATTTATPSNPRKNFVPAQKYLFIGALLLGFLGAALAQVVQTSTIVPLNSINVIAARTAANPAFNLADLKTYAGLPVGSVESYPAASAWGTAIFIPQYHKNPGSDASETKNDSAQKTQEEIYQVISFLLNQPAPPLVMVEGELSGPVPAEKIASLAQKIKQRDDCLSLYQSLKKALQAQHVDAKAQEALVASVDQMLAQANREIILTGAPLVEKAEGKAFTLVGAENQQTRDESKTLVRNYIYLEDRMHELARAPSTRQSQVSLFDSQYSQLLDLLLNDRKTPTAAFTALERKATDQGKTQLAALIGTTKQAFDQLVQQDSTKISQETAVAPSRDDNPYRTITSKKQLEGLIAESEKHIDAVVVDQRNRETAQNFAVVLKAEDKKVGIIQFGAGHKKGLVKELNQLGLSVIVVTPSEVVARQEVL